MNAQKICWLLNIVLMPLILCPMQLQLTSAVDGGTLNVSAQPWYDFLPELKQADSMHPLTLPLAYSCIQRAHTFLTTDPLTSIEETPFDAQLAHELFLLNPPESSHAVHVLAQQAAHTYNHLFAAAGQGPSTDKHICELETFLNSCPAGLRIQINIYAYLLYVHMDARGCLHEFFNNFIDPQEQALHPSGKLIQHIADLPNSRNQTLAQAALENQEDVALYALALGADPTLPVRIKLTCHCCAQSFLVPHYQDVSLIKLCSNMPRLKKKIVEK